MQSCLNDILGSILYVMDEKGTKVFDASYDAWADRLVTSMLYRTSKHLKEGILDDKSI